MIECPICGVSTAGLLAPSASLTPLAHSKKKQSWCTDCQAASPVDYFDFNTRDTSIKYLGKLASRRQGREQFETICKVQDIIRRHPEKRGEAMLYPIMRTCERCGLLFSKCITAIDAPFVKTGRSTHRYKESSCLCTNCTACVINERTPMRELPSGAFAPYSTSF